MCNDNIKASNYNYSTLKSSHKRRREIEEDKLLLFSAKPRRSRLVRCDRIRNRNRDSNQQQVRSARTEQEFSSTERSESSSLVSLRLINHSIAAESGGIILMASGRQLDRSRGGAATAIRTLVSFVAALVPLIALLAIQAAHPVEGVDCFKCSSRNGSNPACEDPFHNLNSTRITSPILPDQQPSVIYHTPCYAGKKGRDGLFPASACIKLTGTFDITGETLVVRHCALDSGTLTQDTELARMSHCGKFQFEGDLLKGCVLACPEDACNAAPKAANILLLRLLVFVSALCASAPVLFAARSPKFT